MRLGPGEECAGACTTCGTEYSAEDGLLRLGVGALPEESARERRIRDEEAERFGRIDGATPDDEMEIAATLEALDLKPNHAVFEMGPGRGRLTRLVGPACGLLVGVDISLGSLRVAIRDLGEGCVGLVHGDATAPLVKPRAFDRVLGTLTSNLPDPESRVASYRVAAGALVPSGKFVFSTHYYGIRARMAGIQKEGRYVEGGIYRCLLEPREVRAELAPFFERVRVRPIQVRLPFLGRLGFPPVAVDRVARRVPGLRLFGELLLVVASRPVRL